MRILPVSDTDEFGDEVVESLKIYLVNHTEKDLNFEYHLRYAGKPDFSLGNTIPASKDFYLHDIPFENLNDAPAFDFTFTLFKPEKTKAAYVEASLKLKAKLVFMRVDEMRKKGEASFAFKLLNRYPDKAPEEDIPEYNVSVGKGNKLYDAKQGRKHLEPAKYEIDLHIEKLTPDWKNLSNFEMLTLQLNQLEKYLDLAIAHHQHNLIVIHGVGTGKLKDEIHEILKSRREVRSFINQYDPRYGYGATEIFL